MAQVLIRDLGVKVVERLKHRARQHGRSLEAELRGILELAAAADLVEARTLASQLRRRLKGPSHSDSVALVTDDRRR